ncbi:MAG: hypothetical protein NTZ27_02270 [Ignavibacteriales bacterium]|nr:hypothetical protein [Ignavibacteriales bacterium]
MKKIKIIMLLLLATIPLMAQGGSLYSGFGIGDLRTSYSARRFAMGEMGIALSDVDYLNSMNPAGWNSLRLTRFELSMNYNGSNIQSASSSAFYSKTGFNGMMLGFPVEHDLGLSVTLGQVPYSQVGYEIKTNVNDTLVGNYNYSDQGEGGISKMFIGTSYRLPFDFSIGLSYDYYIGRVTHNLVANFDATSTFKSATFEKETSYHGMGFTSGIISSDLSKLFGSTEFKDFRIGFVYTPSVTLSADSVNNSTTSIGTITTSTGSIKNNLPYKLGIGTTFKYTNNYTFTLDYLYQPFSEYTSNGKQDINLQNYYKLGLGFEYRNADTRSNAFWDHVMYRTGLSFEQTQFKIKETGINQYSIYGGISLPISFDNTIDLAFQYAKRGTTDNNLLLENIYKFTVTISIGDLWFIRPDR